MGRQSARIYFNQKDHKEMVTWNGSTYQYHDKAYIWNGSEFELVWEKLYGLKLLYDTTLALKPVSSENNKYLYFTEGGNDTIIYRLKINDRTPEKEEWYTGNKYTVFSAPTSSRGFGIWSEPINYSVVYDYQILNLENGGIYTTDTFNAWDYFSNPQPTITAPPYTNQELSPAESELGHSYASMLSSIINIAQRWNCIFFVAPTGISAMQLANREGDGSLISGKMSWDIGRLNDGTARGLFPRFLMLTQDGKFQILEYGYGNFYSAEITSTPPFTPNMQDMRWGVVRDGKLPIVDNTGRIWILEIGVDEITYTDTGIDSHPYGWDVSPDYKFIMTFKYTWDFGGELKIFDARTKNLVVDVNDEIGLSTTGGFFVGHKCFFVQARKVDGGLVTTRNRLYKWR